MALNKIAIIKSAAEILRSKKVGASRVNTTRYTSTYAHLLLVCHTPYEFLCVLFTAAYGFLCTFFSSPVKTLQQLNMMAHISLAHIIIVMNQMLFSLAPVFALICKLMQFISENSDGKNIHKQQ